jgi:hypothetical protein
VIANSLTPPTPEAAEAVTITLVQPRRSKAGRDTPPGIESPRQTIKAAPFVYRDPKTIPPREWLYDHHFARGYVSTDIAPGGVGKTSNVLVECIAMASGRNLLGAAPPRPLTVWYVNLEDPLEEIERRIAAILIHYRIQPDEIAGRLFINSGRDTPLVIVEKLGDKFEVTRPVVDALSDEIRANKVDVILVDPFVNCHTVPENDNGAVNTVVRTWARIADECSCSVCLVHHVRKASNGQTEFTADDARGAGALIGAVRSARVLNVMTKDEAAQSNVEEKQRTLHFRVDNGKQNMRPPMERAQWRKLVSVCLDNATEENPSDWIGVVTAWALPGAFDGVETQHLRDVQNLIAGQDWAENSQSSNWAGHAVADVLGLDAEDPAARKRIKTLLRTWIENKVLRKESVHDTRAGRRRTMIRVGERA